MEACRFLLDISDIGFTVSKPLPYAISVVLFLIFSINLLLTESLRSRRFFLAASNFARYGLAEKYYADSINYITNEYPYDGSQREKIEWQLSSSYLDRHIFENEYPRTTGYINFGLDLF